MSPNIEDEEKLEIDSQMSGMIGRLMVAVENYPQLEENQNSLQLQAAVKEVEEQISAARKFYMYVFLKQILTNTVAQVCHFLM